MNSKRTAVGSKVKAIRHLLGSSDPRVTIPGQRNEERPIAPGAVGEVKWFAGRGARRVLGIVFETPRGPAHFSTPDRPGLWAFEVIA